MSLGGKLKSFMTGAFQGASQGLPQAVDVFTAGQERKQQQSQFNQEFQQQQTANFLAEIQGVQTAEELNSLDAGYREMDNISPDIMGRITSAVQGRRSGFVAEEELREAERTRQIKEFDRQLKKSTTAQLQVATRKGVEHAISSLGNLDPKLALAAAKALDIPGLTSIYQIVVDNEVDLSQVRPPPTLAQLQDQMEAFMNRYPDASYEDAWSQSHSLLTQGAFDPIADPKFQTILNSVANMNRDAALAYIDQNYPFMPADQKNKLLQSVPEDDKKQGLIGNLLDGLLGTAKAGGVGTVAGVAANYGGKALANLALRGAGSMTALELGLWLSKYSPAIGGATAALTAATTGVGETGASYMQRQRSGGGPRTPKEFQEFAKNPILTSMFGLTYDPERKASLPSSLVQQQLSGR